MARDHFLGNQIWVEKEGRLKVEKKLDIEGKLYWRDLQTQKPYGLVVAGLAWPELKPGLVVVGAVDRIEDLELEAWPITILTEFGESDPTALCKAALDLKNQYSIDSTYSYPNASMTDFLEAFNGDRRRRALDQLSIIDAPELHDGSILSGLQLVRRLTHTRRKILSFGSGSLIPRYLVSLSVEDAPGLTFQDEPSIAALSACLSVLSAWRPRHEPVQTQAITEFDLLGSGRDPDYEPR
jgi:hypothetical protein